ncbi:MAG TPA: S8 family serine peptidase [Verrucomicrobiae bacterium]
MSTQMFTLQNSKTRSCHPACLRFPGTLVPALAFGLALSTFVASGAYTPAAHKLQVNDPAVGAQLTATGARLIADYGSYALYESATPTTAAAGLAGVEARDEYNLVLLNAARLDTSKPETQALRKTVGAFAGKRTHLVQFAGPVQPAWRNALLDTGVRIVSYIPRNTYLVYGDASSLAALQALAGRMPLIQWDAPFAPDYKVDPAARLVDAAGQPRDIGTSQFAIQLVADPAANPATLRLVDQLKLRPLKRQELVLNYVNLVVALAPEGLPLLALQPDVVSIQPYFDYQRYCERQAQIIAGNLAGNVPIGPGYLAWLQSKGFTQAQFTSSGFVVDITDTGLDNGTTDPNHPGLHMQGNATGTSRVAYNRIEGLGNFARNDCIGHGTLNGHIIGGYDDTLGFPFSDDQGYHPGLGVCPFVRIGASMVFDPDGWFTDPNFANLQSRAYRDGARVSNNSWGSSVPGTYTVDSQQYDALVRDAQPTGSAVPAAGNQGMVIVFAAGNNGDFGARTVGAPASAKNVITVGASENVQFIGDIDGCGTLDAEADSANDIWGSSSRGPCADGRHKPDLVAPGTRVSGGVPQAQDPAPTGTADPCFVLNGMGVCGSIQDLLFYPTNQEFFTIGTGTSFASPAVAGGAALVRQFFINRFGGPPSAAMTKAYLLNSARHLKGQGANDSLWSNAQGMGEMNLGFAFDSARRILRDQLAADTFTASGQTRTFTGTINDSSLPFRVTLAWSDAPGSTTGAAYNNDLDLVVTLGNFSYKGNVFSGSTSTTGGSADSRNNVESVFLPPGYSGPFTITITAADINSDGVPNNAEPLDQDFALVVYNAKPSGPLINGIQPPDQTVVAGQFAAFTVNATSSEVMRYQWRKDGTNIANAITNSYSILSAELTNAGGYSVVVSDINGASTSAVARLTVIPSVPLPFAINNSNFVWLLDTNLPWYGQTNFSHDRVASGRSFFVTGAQRTYLQATNNSPGQLSFWWKINSATNAGLCTFTVTAKDYTNGTQMYGPRDWTNETFYLPAGPHTFEWSYTDSSGELFLTNGVFLDQVTYIPGATLPFIIAQPTNQSVLGANPVTFTVIASGTPTLGYQWRFNSVPITDATNSYFTIAGVGPFDVGRYSVEVTNSFGSIISADAALEVVPVVLGGDNIFGQAGATLSATNVIAIAAGAYHTLVVRRDGVVLGWGNNSAGQLDVPQSLTNAMAVAGGGAHSLALLENGTVIGWGDNSAGQATPPAGLANVTAIAAGSRHSVALKTDGTLATWGDNSLGQLSVPAGLTGVVAVAAGGDHTLALRADGTVLAWGGNTDPAWNYSGQSVVPWGLTGVADVSAGTFHSLSVKTDGSVLGWGYNGFGETVAPADATNIVAVAAGNQFSLAVRRDHTAVGWGLDWNSQYDFLPSLTNVTALAAGDAHTVVLLGRPDEAPGLVRAAYNGSQFRTWVQTVVGKNYAFERTSSLPAAAWVTISWVRGNGAMQLFADPAAGGPQSFYRVRQW